jgi:ribosomal protein L19
MPISVFEKILTLRILGIHKVELLTRSKLRTLRLSWLRAKIETRRAT